MKYGIGGTEGCNVKEEAYNFRCIVYKNTDESKMWISLFQLSSGQWNFQNMVHIKLGFRYCNK